MTYVGPERRIHRVYMTRNSEYHVRRDVCVGVRDRLTGRWKLHHPALGLRLDGAARNGPDGLVLLGRTPEPGERLCFADAALVTSSLDIVIRPPREIVERYPIRASA